MDTRLKLVLIWYTNFRGADLRFADLQGADLTGANFQGANLAGADLSGVNLSETKGIKSASCHWYNHGETGRQLLAVEIDSEIMFFCGCFSGNISDLKRYIDNGEEQYKKSRTKAMEFLLSCFED